jgi:RNA polymerase sigma-70 factor (ECF subfamily)
MKTSIGNVGYLIHHGVAALRTKWQAMENEEPAPGKARSPALAAA